MVIKRKIKAKLTPLVFVVALVVGGGWCVGRTPRLLLLLFSLWMKQITKLGFLLILGVSMSADAGLFGFGGKSWKEEVLLHDGKMLIVERTQTRDPFGNREFGQPPPVSEETLRFTSMDSSQVVTWKSDFGPALQDNLSLLALEILDGKSFIMTYPTRCHAYNKWGRPNPPYVFFKFDGKMWQRISLEELPKEIKQANVIIGGYDGDERRLLGLGISLKETVPYMSIDIVKRINKNMSPDTQYLRLFVLEPMKPGTLGVSCEEIVYYKGAWVGPGDSIGRRMMDRMSK